MIGAELYVPPLTSFAGFGALERRELCNLVANFEVTTLLSKSVGGASDIAARFQKDVSDGEMNTFARRLKEAADELFVSDVSERTLRIRLWL